MIHRFPTKKLLTLIVCAGLGFGSVASYAQSPSPEPTGAGPLGGILDDGPNSEPVMEPIESPTPYPSGPYDIPLQTAGPLGGIFDDYNSPGTFLHAFYVFGMGVAGAGCNESFQANLSQAAKECEEMKGVLCYDGIPSPCYTSAYPGTMITISYRTQTYQCRIPYPDGNPCSPPAP